MDAINMTMTEVAEMSENDFNNLYKENEHYNLHIENMVLEAKRYGCPWLVAKCESFYYKYIRQGYLGIDLREEHLFIYNEIKKYKEKFKK